MGLLLLFILPSFAAFHFFLIPLQSDSLYVGGVSTHTGVELAYNQTFDSDAISVTARVFVHPRPAKCITKVKSLMKTKGKLPTRPVIQ